MCMELIEKTVKPGELVWDIGCGTGILGVSAVLLGAGRVVAVDRDTVAVSAANINSALNHTEAMVEVREGDLMRGWRVSRISSLPTSSPRSSSRWQWMPTAN